MMDNPVLTGYFGDDDTRYDVYEDSDYYRWTVTDKTGVIIASGNRCGTEHTAAGAALEYDPEGA